MNRWGIVIALAIGASVGYLGRPTPESRGMSAPEQQALAAELRTQLAPSLYRAARSATVPTPRDGTATTAQSSPALPACEPQLEQEEDDPIRLANQEEQLVAASDLVTSATDLEGVWSQDDGHSLSTMWPQLSAEGRDQVATELMVAINSGNLEVAPGAPLP